MTQSDIPAVTALLAKAEQGDDSAREDLYRLLDVSVSTIKGDWAAARAWLFREMTRHADRS